MEEMKEPTWFERKIKYVMNIAYSCTCERNTVTIMMDTKSIVVTSHNLKLTIPVSDYIKSLPMFNKPEEYFDHQLEELSNQVIEIFRNMGRPCLVEYECGWHVAKIIKAELL